MRQEKGRRDGVIRYLAVGATGKRMDSLCESGRS